MAPHSIHFRWRNFLHPFFNFEYLLRFATNVFDQTYSKYSTTFTLIYGYLVLQLVGILWAFITNLGLALALNVAKEISTSALELNDSTTPISTWRKREITATVYVIYATFRVIFKFMQSSVSTITQSIKDFPQARSRIIKIATHSPQEKGQQLFHILIATFLPNIVLSLSLIFTSELECSDAERNLHFSSQKTVTSRICFDLPFGYISKRFVLPRKILTFVLILSLIQYSIVILNQFPSWSKTFPKRVKIFFDAYVYFVCLFTSVHIFKIVNDFLERFLKLFDLFEYCGLDEKKSQEFVSKIPFLGQHLLFAWLAGLFMCGWACLQYSKPILNDAGALKMLFTHLKNSFIVFSVLIFVVEMINPDEGFINAQIDLTLLTIAIPAFHVTLAMCVENALSSNEKVLKFLPVATIISYTACHFSRAKGVGSFFVVTQHVVTKIIQLFGSKSSELEDEEEFVEDLLEVEEEYDDDSNSSNANKKNKISQELKKSIITKYKEKIIAGQEEKKRKKKISPHLILSSLGKFSLSFAVIVIFVVALIAMTAFLQTKKEFYPDLIEIKNDVVSQKIHLNHVNIAKLSLDTNYPKREADLPLLTPPKYASCDTSWNELSLLDFALLAEVAYFDPGNVNLDEIVEQMFTNKDDEKVNEKLFEVKIPPLEMRTTGTAQFFEAYSAQLNLSVIAIRGTDVGRLSDIIEDVKIFKEPVLLSILSMMFPTIRLWPDNWIIHCLSQTLGIFGLGSDASYIRGVLSFVREIKEQNSEREIILTGHSLGGGLARIVGAIEHLPSVTFSPPGFRKSFYKFLFSEMKTDRELDRAQNLLNHMSVAVLPESDPITAVDTQVGLTQRISCDVKEQAFQNSCHMLEGTICNLLESCGDPRKRFAACEFSFGLGGLSDYMNIDHQTLIVTLGILALVLVMLFFAPL